MEGLTNCCICYEEYKTINIIKCYFCIDGTICINCFEKIKRHTWINGEFKYEHISILLRNGEVVCRRILNPHRLLYTKCPICRSIHYNVFLNKLIHKVLYDSGGIPIFYGGRFHINKYGIIVSKLYINWLNNYRQTDLFKQNFKLAISKEYITRKYKYLLKYFTYTTLNSILL